MRYGPYVPNKGTVCRPIIIMPSYVAYCVVYLPSRALEPNAFPPYDILVI